MGYVTGLTFTGAPGTTAPVTGALTPYAMCAGEGRFTGVPTADTKGPPTGCPMVGAAYIPTPVEAGVACLVALEVELVAAPFV